MRFEVKTELTKQDFSALLTLSKKKASRFARILTIGLKVLAVLLGVGLVAEIILLHAWDNGPLMRRVGLYLILLLIWIALWPLFQRMLAGKMLETNSKLLKGTFRFTDDEVQESAEHMSGNYAYTSFWKLYHSQGIYFLYIDKGHVFILPERCFTQGDPAAFGSFIAEKTGLEVKEIK